MFKSADFKATKWDTAQDKANFANQFVSFLKDGCCWEDFSEAFYRRLSCCFGHIAHFDRIGFYNRFFTSTNDIVRFLETCLNHPCYGDPEFTYSDVERALQQWMNEEDILRGARTALLTETKNKEIELLKQLQKKYPEEIRS